VQRLPVRFLRSGAGIVSGLRRYAPMKPSRGTEWPPEVKAEITRLDGGRCVCERAGFPPEVVARCGGSLETDHVRKGGTGMKSESVVSNGVTLSAWCHRWKTENGKVARPKLLDWIAVRDGGCIHVDYVWGCSSCRRRSDPLTLSDVAG
jgi:hypothetical protein